MGVVSAKDLPKYLKYGSGRLFWLPRVPSMFKEGSRPKEWRCNNWNSLYAGKEAFTSISTGYFIGRLSGRNYLAHRVIWALVKGYWPNKLLDHINGDRTDNRIENLREVDHSANGRNSKMRMDNSSGVTGVSWHKDNNCWVVQAHNKYFGSFKLLEDAVSQREEVDKMYNYSIRHGSVK